MFVLIGSFALAAIAMVVWFHWPTLADAAEIWWAKLGRIKPRHIVRVFYRITVTHRARNRMLAHVHDVATALRISPDALEYAIYDYNRCLDLGQQGRYVEGWDLLHKTAPDYSDDVFSLAVCTALLHRGILWGSLAGSQYDLLQQLCMDFEAGGELTAFLSRVDRRNPYLDKLHK
ncbi:hypothetical protein GCM10011609_57250 [Lentzea pudingi]|uniref:Uncharacterized protein n=1 Tax=Lentzea pudingi TaxID=1789439 RepID=A0ABQ2IFY6_9PSEU|nr:hypothetical protein [Lentzea pudingi]GGN10016.1 hypothetical protein GCM10011609_57250 [Lentzea pudingi]